MSCHVKDLKNKEVINICDGQRLGFVCDIEVDIRDGRVVSLVLPGDGGFFSKSDDIRIPWCDVTNVGDDVILVTINDISKYKFGCECDKKKKKGFF